MKQKYVYIFFLISIFSSLLVLCLQNKKNIEYETTNNKTNFESEKIIKVSKNSELLELNIDDYLVGVVSCEMPASFEEEALKAGAVAARTYLLNKLENNNEYVITSTTNDQCYSNAEELKEKWKEDYDKYLSKIQKVVMETHGEYMTYKDEIIKAFYFSTSNGKTENVENVFGEKLDYLVSVNSIYDTNTTQFSRTIEIPKNEFLTKLNLDKSNTIEITNVIKNETNRVDKITINDKVFKGTEVRKLLDLRSTDFEIEINNDNVIISTKGYGHGVGMSQYGANELAKMGYDYEKILKHYYTGIKIVK